MACSLENLTIDELVDRHVNLALFFLGRFRRSHLVIRRLNIDDAHQEALIGLWEAAQAWQPERARFSVVVRIHIFKRLFAAAYRDSTIAIPRGFAGNTKNRELAERTRDNLKSLGNYDVGVEYPDHLANRDEVAKAMIHLSPRQKEYIHLRYWEGLQYDEIGARYGITRQAVEQQIKKALEMMREALA